MYVQDVLYPAGAWMRRSSECPWMDCHDLCSLLIISAYFHVGDVARGHDYMAVGGRVTPGAVTEESEATTYRDEMSGIMFHTIPKYLHTPQGHPEGGHKGTEVHVGNIVCARTAF